MNARAAPWVQLLLLPALFYAGAKLSLTFALMPEVMVLLWIPNGILLAALFHYGTQRYLYFALGIVIAELLADYSTFSPLESVLFAIINLAEITIAYALLRYWRFNPRFTAPIDLAKFVLAGPVIGAVVSACAAAGVYSYYRGDEMGYFEFVRLWWFSDGLGLLIVTPLVLSTWPPFPRTGDERTTLRWYDAVAIMGGVLVVIGFALSDQGIYRGVPIRSVALLPLALYVAARFSLRTTTSVLVGIVIMVLYMVKNGQKPFGPLPIHQTALSLQEFIFVASIMSLGLSTLLSQLRTNARELEIRVRDRTAELSAANQQLEKLAVTDSLTGLLNRRALFNHLHREMDRARRSGHALALIMFDIDRFKQVNDQYGHAAGDAVLRHVASIAAKVIRSTDMLARYGGEEFIVVAPETDRAHALRLAERMREAMRSSDVAANGSVLRVTASFGVAIWNADDKEPERILKRADEALYAAKAGGRDRVVTDTPTRVSA